MQRIVTGLGASAAPAGRAAVSKRLRPTSRKARKILAEQKEVRLTERKLAKTIAVETQAGQAFEAEAVQRLRNHARRQDGQTEEKQAQRGKTVQPEPRSNQRDAVADFAITASRGENNIPGFALQHIRQAIINAKAREDLKKNRKALPTLDEKQRNLRRDVDNKYDLGDRGKHIWVFCHLRTKQVLYSLDNKLTV